MNLIFPCFCFSGSPKSRLFPRRKGRALRRVLGIALMSWWPWITLTCIIVRQSSEFCFVTWEPQKQSFICCLDQTLCEYVMAVLFGTSMFLIIWWRMFVWATHDEYCVKLVLPVCDFMIYRQVISVFTLFYLCYLYRVQGSELLCSVVM